MGSSIWVKEFKVRIHWFLAFKDLFSILKIYMHVYYFYFLMFWRLGFSLLTFVRGLLQKDRSILYIFRVNILR